MAGERIDGSGDGAYWRTPDGDNVARIITSVSARHEEPFLPLVPENVTKRWDAFLLYVRSGDINNTATVEVFPGTLVTIAEKYGNDVLQRALDEHVVIGL